MALLYTLRDFSDAPKCPEFTTLWCRKKTILTYHLPQHGHSRQDHPHDHAGLAFPNCWRERLQQRKYGNNVKREVWQCCRHNLPFASFLLSNHHNYSTTSAVSSTNCVVDTQFWNLREFSFLHLPVFNFDLQLSFLLPKSFNSRFPLSIFKLLGAFVHFFNTRRSGITVKGHYCCSSITSGVEQLTGNCSDISCRYYGLWCPNHDVTALRFVNTDTNKTDTTVMGISG